MEKVENLTEYPIKPEIHHMFTLNKCNYKPIACSNAAPAPICIISSQNSNSGLKRQAHLVDLSISGQVMEVSTIHGGFATF